VACARALNNSANNNAKNAPRPSMRHGKKNSVMET
jgi:hypothetical protein